MKNIFTHREPTFLNLMKLMALALFFCMQTIFILPAIAQDPIVTNSATYDVFMNLDPSRGLNPTNFANDVSSYLNTLGAAAGSYRLTTSSVTLDPTDVAKWEVYDHYDNVWYANQTAWSASPGGFNNGNIPSNWYYYNVSDYYSPYSKTTIADLLANPTVWAQMQTHGLQSHIYPYVENGKPAMQFYGYGQIAAADFLYYPADVASTKTVKFDVDASNVSTHTLNSAGFLINGGTSGAGASKTISGYLLLFAWNGDYNYKANSLASVKIYKLSNVNVDILHNNWSSVASYNPSTYMYEPGTLIASSTFSTFYTKSHIELSITSTSLTATVQQVDESGNLTGSKSTMFNSQALTNSGFGGFGPFVLYNSHGCTMGTGFRYSNLEMALGSELSGSSSLEPYKFAEYLNNSTNRFFVNLTNTSATNYSAASNDMDNAYLTRIEADKVIMITDESTGTYLPGTLNQNIKNVSTEPTDATVALKISNFSSLTPAQQLAAKTAYLIFNTTLGSYGTIPIPSTTAVASLYIMDSPGTDASWTGAKQVNEINSWLVSGASINIYFKHDQSVNASGLTATYTLKNPSGTNTVITPSTDANGKLYYAFPKSSATGAYSVTLSYATGGSITTTVPATSTFNFAPVPQLDGSPVITGTMQYGQILTVTPNITSVPGIAGTLSYQWKANGVAITNATNQTYKLSANEVGKTISCDITSNAQQGTKSATASGTVSQVTLTPTVSVVNSKTYNGTTVTTGGTISFSGTVNSETPTYNATIVWTSANAGTSTVNVSGISLSNMADRYVLSVTSLSNVTPGNNATISKATLTVTGSTVTSKTYDGSTTAAISSATLSGKLGSDDVALANSTSGIFNNANVGTGKTVTAAMTISGSAAGNYTLTQPTPTGNITAKSVTITGVTAASKVYDGLTAATLSGYVVSTYVGTETLTITTGTGAFANKNVGTKAVTASGFAIADGANGGLASNYSLSGQPVIANQSITAKPISVTADTKTKVYGQADPSLTYTFAPSLITGDSFTGSVSRTAGENVGSFAINQNSLTLSSNYTLNYTSADLSITAKPISVTADTKTKVYGQADPSLTYTFAPSLITGDSFTGSVSRTSGENVGSFAINQNSLTLSSNYTLNYTSADLSITAKPIAVTAGTKTKVYGESDPTLTYTFTPALVSGDVFTGSVSRTAGENVGSFSINKNDLALSSNYTLNFSSADLSITAKPISVTADIKTKVYGEADPSLTYIFTPALISGDAFTGSVSRTAGENVGSFSINKNDLALSSNYTLNFTSADLSITAKPISVTADTKTKVYGESDPSLTYTFTPALISGDAFTGSVSRTAGENVGSFAINKNSLALSSNYTLNYTSADLSITVKPIAVSADTKTKVYGESDPALTYTFTPALISGDAFTGSVLRTAGENVGSFAINQNSLALSSNYTLNYTSADLSITAKPIAVTADTKTKVYGESDPALTYTLTPALISGDAFTGSVSRTAGENVGTFSINKNDLALSSNYTLNFTSADLSITAKPISVTADTKTKVYGEADPSLTYIFTPALISGDAFTGSVSRTAGENVGSFSINKNDLALSSNYTLNFTSSDLSITAKSISVTADTKTKVYGESDPTLTYTFTPALISGDAFTGSVSRTSGENVGSFAINQNSLALSSNYTLNFTSSDLSITAKSISVTADTKTKVYGESDPTLTYTFSPALILGDAFTGSLSRTTGENVGAYSITGGDLALSSNYAMTYTPADLTVNKAPLTVTADTKEKVYGSVNPVLTFRYNGFIAGEDESVLDTKPLTTTSVTVNSDAGNHVEAIIVNGGDDNNYQFSYLPADFNITKAILTATANDKTKVYGKTNPELTFSYSGFVNGDDSNVIDVHPTIVTDATITSPVGVYPVILALGSDNNYIINRTDGSLTVTKALLTATADNKSKLYSKSNPPLTVSYTGFVNGDGASSLDVAPVPSTEATVLSGTGSYPVILSAGSDNNYEITNVDGVLTVNKSVLKVTADNKRRIYNEANPALTISYSGFVNGDNLSSIDSKPSASTSAAITSDAGSYSISVNGGSDNNYSFEYQNGTLEIVKADQVITFQTIPSGLRATENQQLNATSTSGLPVRFESSDPGITDINGNKMSVVREGTVTITATQEGNQNYNPAKAVAQTIETMPTFDNIRSLFTPNSDGMNDYWYIPDIEQYGSIIHIQIYNRFGKMVYESPAYKNDWDGTYNGKPLPEGSYYYLLKGSEKKVIIKGVVNIVR